MEAEKLTTTFANLHSAGACAVGYRRLAKALGGVKVYGRETPISLVQILDANGLDDALWALDSLPDTPEVQRFSRLFSCDCADRVRHLMTDERSRHAVDVARRHALGDATDEELAAARDAAWDAARDAARAAAWDAARDAAWAAVWDAAWAAAWAAARAAARAAAWAAARDVERSWQESRLRELLAAVP